MTLDAYGWERALFLLGEELERRGATPCHLVVCGGTALLATGVVSRVTRDVDVLATRGEVDGEISCAYPLPEEIRNAAADVAVELGLPANWVNAATSMLIGPLEDLHKEIWQDLEERSYASCLRISYVGRGGQIFLKFRALAGRAEDRDADDLKALSPDAATCRRAIDWVRQTGAIDAAGEKRLQKILTELGHGLE
jgi:hypothetical protein